MTIFLHELKKGGLSLIIWSSVIAFMLGICIIIYPEMSSQMTEVSDVFSEMGSFSEAFGMDQINFGEFKGYFGIECGNNLGLGGALFAAILGVSMIAKEESDKTAEFLLTHPVSRNRILTEKLIAIVAEITIFNLIVIVVCQITSLVIGETLLQKTFVIMFFAYYLLQLEIAFVTFGISAFFKKGAMGVGLGVAMVFYFLNIAANLTDDLSFLKYLTPFGFADGTAIISDNAINLKYVAVGVVFSLLGIIIAYAKYNKKDIT